MEQQQQNICCGRSCSVISDTLQLPPSSSSGLQYPWLVSYHTGCSKEETDQIFFSSTKPPKEHYHRRIPELFGRKIRGCFHGWLILSKFPSPDLSLLEFCLWNPVTQEFINLPHLKLELEPKPLGDNKGEDEDEDDDSDEDEDDDEEEEDDDILSCFLSSPPSNPDSVVMLSRYSKHNLVFCLLHNETKAWTEISYAQQIRDIYISNEQFEGQRHLICTPVCCSNKLYALTTSDHVIQINILVNHNYKNSEVEIDLLHYTEIPEFDFGYEISDSYLVGSCGELFTIIVSAKKIPSKEIQSIQLFKLDFSTMTWEEMKSSKDHVFFLVDARYSPISCPVIESQSGSHIHIIQDMCKLYSYNMEDKTISLSYLSCPDIRPTLWPRHTSLWILPESRFVDDHGEAKSKTDTKEEQGKKEEMVVRSVVNDEIGQMMNEQQLGRKMKSHLLDIPFHMLELIAEHCVAIEYLNFRATCKHFRLAAPSKQWSTATALGRLQTHSLVSPWLVVLDKPQGIVTFKDPKFGDKYFMTTPPDLIGNAVICSSRYGWLLIFTGFICLHFFNPLTRAVIRLPDLPLCCYSSFAFSAPPTSPDCIIVVWWQCTIHITYPGLPIWRRLFIGRNIRSDLSFHKSLAFCGQNLYFFTRKGKLGVCRIGADNYEFLVHKPPNKSCGQRFLVECSNNLISIVVDEFGKRVEVFKLNHSTLKWETVNNLGKHMIYVCGTESFSAVAKISGMENKIYFPRFYGGKIAFYSLDMCKYQTFGNKDKDKEEAFTDFSSTTEQLLGAWIEPSWSV